MFGFDRNIYRVEALLKIKDLSSSIIENPHDVDSIRELQQLVAESNHYIIKTAKAFVLAAFLPIIKSEATNKNSFTIKEKEVFINTLKLTLDKLKVDNRQMFFNIYGFLLFEIYNPGKHEVLDVPEEYKLSVVDCIISLVRSIGSDIIPQLYTKENSARFCQMLYVLVSYAKNERFKKLRISSINCMMAIAGVLDDDDFSNVTTRHLISETIFHYLPGIATHLKTIALSDEKFGHKLHSVALKAWGRVVTLMMKDYNQLELETQVATKKDVRGKKANIERNSDWYKSTDEKLLILSTQFSKLTYHSHFKVRLELVKMVGLIIENCFKTMPLTVRRLIVIVITLLKDDDETVSQKSEQILRELTQKLNANDFRPLLESLQDGFHSTIWSLPSTFKGIDEREQMAALNLVNGYVSLFGRYNLNKIFSAYAEDLIKVLLIIIEIETNEVCLLEQYENIEFDPIHIVNKRPWRKFVNFRDEKVEEKFESLCYSLGHLDCYREVVEILISRLTNDDDRKRKEVILILNAMLQGINENDCEIFRTILNTYLDKAYWNIPLSVMADNNLGYECTVSEVRNNVIQACLLVEGIGLIALARKKKFDEFLLKTIYFVIERVGSGQPSVHLAGLTTLNTITTACGYANITDLVTKNIDFFTFHVERKLKRLNENIDVLNVYSVVMKHCTKEVLPTVSVVIEELLMKSCDEHHRTKCNAYFRVFKVFIQCLTRWFNMTPIIPPLKTKAEKLAEVEHFKVQNLGEWSNCNDFSDDIMDKTAEELYEEDMKKGKESIEEGIKEQEPDVWKKPDPPIEVKITTAILQRCCHFIPSQDLATKLLAIEISRGGLEIIRDWEDELLPIVHQIWMPLVHRFKEFDKPLVINYSFQLLIIMARLSKDFIRNRTAKEVFPNILQVLDKLAKESYLKDAGSTYRYTQAYKLQLVMLNNLARILIELDMKDEDFILAMKSVFVYLSNKQPIPLQKGAISFFQIFIEYDPVFARDELEKLRTQIKNIECEKNVNLLLE